MGCLLSSVCCPSCCGRPAHDMCAGAKAQCVTRCAHSSTSKQARRNKRLSRAQHLTSSSTCTASPDLLRTVTARSHRRAARSHQVTPGHTGVPPGHARSHRHAARSRQVTQACRQVTPGHTLRLCWCAQKAAASKLGAANACRTAG
jgi:hypothetical protein